MAWFASNWSHLAVAVLAVLELVSLFVPGSSGTLSGLIKAVSSIPGVSDPKIGGQ